MYVKKILTQEINKNINGVVFVGVNTQSGGRLYVVMAHWSTWTIGVEERQVLMPLDVHCFGAELLLIFVKSSRMWKQIGGLKFLTRNDLLFFFDLF